MYFLLVWTTAAKVGVVYFSLGGEHGGGGGDGKFVFDGELGGGGEDGI